MNISQKFFILFCLTASVAISACNEDDEKSSSLSKADAKTQISAFNSDAKADLQDVSNAKGLEAVKEFFALADQDDPFGRIASDRKNVKAFLKAKGNSFKSIFAPESITNGKQNSETEFDFDGNTGIYEWNVDNQVFVKTGEAEIIKIKFPTEGSETNNAELQLTAYVDQLVVDSETGIESYEPTLLKAKVLVDGSESASLDLSIDYDASGFPVEANITLAVTPFSATLSFSNTATTSSTISFSVKQGSETLAATSVTVKYKDSSKSEESLSVLEGYVQLKNLKLQGSVDFSGSNDGQSLNDYLKLAIFVDGKKAGDVVFETVNAEEVPYVKWNDGTKEKLETVFQPVIDELDALSDDLNSNG